MKDYMAAYEQRKGRVISFLEQTIDYLIAQDKKTEAESVATLKKSVEQYFFSIVVVGEFSSGKSTFLNALMRQRILPSFTSETTATVNFLRHKSQASNGEAGIVYYINGEHKEISDLNLNTIEKFVSTRGDEGDKHIATTIDHVDLFLDSKFLYNGVMLVDSPGLNGIADYHREITEAQIKVSNASIFMFNADHPGSKTDFQFLGNLKNQMNRIFFINLLTGTYFF